MYRTRNARRRPTNMITKIFVGLMALQYTTLFLGIIGYGTVYLFTEPENNPHHPEIWMGHMKRNVLTSLNFNMDLDDPWNVKRSNGNMTASNDTTTTTASPATTTVDPNAGLTCSDMIDDCPSRHTQLSQWLLAFFVGGLGISRFVAGYTGCGVGKLLTCGGCGIWWLIDWIMILTLTYCRDKDACAWEKNM